MQLHLKELVGYKIVDAKYINKVLMVVGEKNGKYDKFIFRTDSSYQFYDLMMKNDITYSGLNFVVLDNDLCIHINGDENVELFSNKKGSSVSKVIDDDIISGDMTLYNNGVQVLFAKNGTLYKLSMK